MNKPPKRGEVFWVSLDPTIGSEINKTRPALILSNDIANQHSSRVIIGPITSSITRIHPFEVKIKMLKGFSKVMLDQIRSVDKIRLMQKIMLISQEEMHAVEKALKIALALY